VFFLLLKAVDKDLKYSNII